MIPTPGAPPEPKSQALAAFAAIAALTAAQIGAFYSGLSRKELAAFLLLAAAAGVAISGAGYMHLARERKWLWILPVVPLALAVVFILALFPDIAWHLTLRYK